MCKFLKSVSRDEESEHACKFLGSLTRLEPTAMGGVVVGAVVGL